MGKKMQCWCVIYTNTEHVMPRCGVGKCYLIVVAMLCSAFGYKNNAVFLGQSQARQVRLRMEFGENIHIQHACMTRATDFSFKKKNAS